MTHTDERVEEIARKICNLTVYGQALHPNDIKHHLTTYGSEQYKKGVADEAKRRDGIERAIEQSIIDQQVMAERARIELEVIRTLVFYPDIQQCVIDIINDKQP